MGILDRFRRRRNDGHDSELRSVIMGVYGGNVQLFAEAYEPLQHSRSAHGDRVLFGYFSPRCRCMSRVTGTETLNILRTRCRGFLRLNPLQNATQFWKDVIKRLLLDNNVFIKPHYDTAGKLKSLFVLPKQA